MNKVSLQTCLKRNSTNSSNIFILIVNLENLIVGLQVLIIFFMLAKFQEDQSSIVVSSKINFKFFFLKSKVVYKK